MPDVNERDAKLIQYLNEALGKEKELETALQAHIGMTTTRPPYKKRLQQHLKETKSHAREVERRIKKLGGGPSTVGTVAGKAIAAAKGPMHALRGTGDEEKLLKNAKTEYSEEHEEIATYAAIEAFADSVGDKETAKLARSIRRDEERMAGYLERLIPQLTKAVVRAEVPSDQRSTGRRSARRSSSKRSSSSSASRKASSTRKAPSRRKPQGVVDPQGLVDPQGVIEQQGLVAVTQRLEDPQRHGIAQRLALAQRLEDALALDPGIR